MYFNFVLSVLILAEVLEWESKRYVLFVLLLKRTLRQLYRARCLQRLSSITEIGESGVSPIVPFKAVSRRHEHVFKAAH
jgi:hypothetical protein